MFRDNKDQDVDVSSLVTADQGVIFFTYPKANTPGWSVERPKKGISTQ